MFFPSPHYILTLVFFFFFAGASQRISVQEYKETNCCWTEFISIKIFLQSTCFRLDSEPHDRSSVGCPFPPDHNFLYFKRQKYALADRWGCKGRAPPPRLKFLHFHAVLEKNGQIPLGVGAPSGKSWIRHWQGFDKR